MKIEKKYIDIINFNVVFGEEEKPMLSYFNNIIYPAFKSNFINKGKNNEYMFMDINLFEKNKNTIFLTGMLVKKTNIEIKSVLNPNKKVVSTNQNYESAPYSIFIINLKNHRMLLFKNQKGSPNLSNFSSTFKKTIKNYTTIKNNILKQTGKKPFPNAIINILGVPILESISNALKQVRKIKKLKLRFHPLNGDLNFNGLTNEIRKTVDSKTGSIIFNSPKSMEGVVEIIDESKGTVDVTMEVEYKNNAIGKIKNEAISKSVEIELFENEDYTEEVRINNKLKSILKYSEDIDSFNFENSSHNEIYDKYKGKILEFPIKRLK
ncbi:MAG: hypothetical protein N4A54_03615 [Peptostreptococcaceae bacterium]|jgi:hypothetical protein|nr:hypothetical protein [Peptostreptococcaceae bacterium]